MTSPSTSDPRTPRQLYHAPPPLAVAVWVTLGAIGTIYVLQGVLFLVVEPIAAMALTYATVAIGFGFVRPPARFFVAAVLVGLTMWYVDLVLVTLLQPPGNAEHLDEVATKAPIVASLVAVAVLPALAEELVFRGVLARSLARRSVPVAIVVSSLAFSAYHVLPIQMVSTFPLALALATMAVRSGSVLPGMLAHFLNNATVIVVARSHSVDHVIDAHAGAFLVLAVATALTGVALAAKGVA
jgi:membrane protease YdiL (CAAX protease family)